MISVKILEEVRDHLSSHFRKDLPGSYFYAPKPELVLEKAMRTKPESFACSTPEADGRIRIYIKFSEPIGICNVVNIEDLTQEEKDSIARVDRNGKIVRRAYTNRVLPTCDCCIVLTADNYLITMFPGLMAPPLPSSPDVPDSFWDKHVFIEPKLQQQS